MDQTTLEKTFPVTNPAHLNLSNIRGSVEIQPGEGTQIQVTAVKRPHSGDADATEIEWSQDADGTVTVATHFRDAAWSWLIGSHPCCVDYVVNVPRTCSLKVRGVSSSLRVGGLEGEFDIASVSGGVTLRALTGPVRIRTVSGGVSAEDLTGALDLDTVSGDTGIKGHLPSVHANSVSGMVNLQTVLGEGPYHFRSVSGDVIWRIPPDSRCSLELHSMSGEIYSSLPLTHSSLLHGSASAEVQGGGVAVSLDSISGNLRLEGAGEPEDPTHAWKPPSAEERRSILERIERGEMSVEEALAQLRA